MAATHGTITGRIDISLYGIIVTEQSFLVGVRAQVKSQLMRDVTTRAAGTHVPLELLQQMWESADRQARKIVEEQWKACTTAASRQHKFGVFGLPTGPGGTSLLDLSALGVDAVPVSSTTLNDNYLPLAHETAEFTNYVHLSTAGHNIRPETILVTPVNNMIDYLGNKAGITIKAHIDAAAPHQGESDGESEQINRLVRWTGIKEPIRAWDGEAVKDFVTLLELEVVPFDESHPLEPDFVQWQRVYCE